MIKKINFSSPLHQFFIVLCTNLIYFILLYSYQVSNYNIHPPEGIYSGNAFFGSDVMTYLHPARNFLKFGTFGNGHTPDYFRTIGYPAYLSGFIYFFGEYFFWVAYLIHAILSALIFSFITAISGFFIKNDPRISKTVFIILWLSGAYWIYFPMLLNDLFFAFFFIAGIYYGIKAVFTKSWKYCVIHLLLLGYAASVRPQLILYAIPEFLILLYCAVHFKTIADRKIKTMIVVASISLLVLGNLSGLRNYINYGSMESSSVLTINLYNYASKEILFMVHRENDYEKGASIADRKGKVSWIDASLFRKKAAFEVMKTYPKETALVLTTHFLKNMGSPHLFRASTLFLPKEEVVLSMGNLNKIKEMNNLKHISTCLMMLKQIGLYTLFILLFFMFFYSFIWLLVLKHIFRMLKEKNYLYLLAIVSFLAYLIIPTTLTAVAGRIRLPIEWLIVLLATIEFYHLWDAYKSQSKYFQRIGISK